MPTTRPPRRHRSALERVAARGFAATVEALYPANDLGVPDARAADMVARAAIWIDELPPDKRRLLLALYAALELGAPALAPGFGPLSRLPVPRRLAMFERLRGARLAPLRFVADAVKSSTTMIYLSHPAVMRYLGAHKACPHPDDPLTMPHRPGALAATEGA